jgi:hypothetical protein
MIGWDDGSELPGVSAEAPSVVQNLAVAPTGVGELTLSWNQATGDATSYSITMTTEAGSGNSSTTYVTSDTDYTFTGLSPANGYSFSVTATNAEGTSSAAQDSFGQAPIGVVGVPWDLTTDLDGAIWVAHRLSNTVQQIVNNENGPWTAQTPIEVGKEPFALTTGLDGSIWVANLDSGSVQQIVKNDNGVWTAQAAIGVGNVPVALTTALDKSIWVANAGSDTVQQIVKNDNGVWTAQAAIGVGTRPFALTTALDGSIWVANLGSDTVQQIVKNDNGVWTAQAAIGVGTKPVGLTSGFDGSIWVTSVNGSGQAFIQQLVNDDSNWLAQPKTILPVSASSLSNRNLVASVIAYNKQQGSKYHTPGYEVDIELWLEGFLIQEINSLASSLSTKTTAGLDGAIWATGLNELGMAGFSPEFEPTGNENGINKQLIYPSLGPVVVNNGLAVAQDVMPIGKVATSIATGLHGSIWVAGLDGTVQQIAVPPSAPVALAAVFGQDSSEVTLNWHRPVSDGGSPVISYTATAVQGDYFQSVTTTDLSCVFDGFTLGSGPTYFTVTATNFAGVGSTATHQVDASGNTIPQQPHTGIGITTNGVPATNGGFDGAGNTYSWTALSDSATGGSLTGSTLGQGGLAVDIGSPNQPNFTWAAGQTVEVTGSGNTLRLAGAAVKGAQTNQQFTLTFTDGSTATWTQSLSDWCDPSGYLGESIISTQPYLNTASGGTEATTNYVYSYGYTLPEGKTLKSITLPNNPALRILGATLASSAAVDLSGDWNAYGLVVANNQVPNSQGFDGHGNYYNANYDGSTLGVETSSNSDFDFMQITWGGATFDLGPAPNRRSQSNNQNGNNNFMQFDGQTIDVVSGDFSTLLMIGAAANGNQTDQAIYLNFSDGTSLRWTQSFTDWANGDGSENNSPPSAAELEATNEALVATTTWVNQVGNNRPGYNRFVYGYSFDIPAGKTLESITLPSNRNVGILGMALV